MNRRERRERREGDVTVGGTTVLEGGILSYCMRVTLRTKYPDYSRCVGIPVPSALT